MNKTLVAAGALTIALAGAVGTSAVVLITQDDVTITQEVIAGDPTYMDGIRLTYCVCAEQPYEYKFDVWKKIIYGLPWQAEPKLMWKTVATFDNKGFTVAEEKCQVDDFTICYQNVCGNRYAGIWPTLVDAIEYVRGVEYALSDEVRLPAVDDNGVNYENLFCGQLVTAYDENVIYMWCVENEEYELPEGLEFNTLYKLTFSDPSDDTVPAHIERVADFDFENDGKLRTYVLDNSGDILIESEESKYVDDEEIDYFCFEIYDHETGELIYREMSDFCCIPYVFSHYAVLEVASEDGKSEYVVLDVDEGYSEVLRTEAAGNLKSVVYDEEKERFCFMSMLKQSMYTHSRSYGDNFFDSVRVNVCDKSGDLYIGDYYTNCTWCKSHSFDTIIVGEPDVDELGNKLPGVNTLEYFGIDYKVDFYR
ncbi:MAG: hypothetical protein K6F92_03745 [Lachnospiraceae bacterium]|nr:hypothetical protein [Lachnospiraceae bacterium]